jgi:biotin carboxyl carrier protein
MADTFKKLLIGDRAYETQYTKKFSGRRAYVPPDRKHIVNSIPGVIVRVYVRPGQKVMRNDPLFVLEAMKMQNDITAPLEGRVKAVHVQVGMMVMKGVVLLEFE